MKILIVDDEEGILNFVRDFASGSGRTILTAADGLEGLAAARKHTPDLIISDTEMPNKSGPEFLDAYCAENPSVRAILMSGRDLQDICKKYPSAAKYEFLQKPFTYKQLMQACRETS